MTPDACILTTRDFAILEAMYERRAAPDPLVPIMRRKLERAHVVPRDDVPENVATLGSRVAFRTDGGAPDTRVVCHDGIASPVGLFLPVTTARGLALLGLAEGGTFGYLDAEGLERSVLLERVLYQPEAARREREALARRPAPAHGRPQLRLIRGAFDGRPPAPAAAPSSGAGWRRGPDDPGPSAA